MTNREEHIPADIPRFDSYDDLRSMTEERVRRQLRQPADDALEDMKTAMREGLLGSLADIFEGKSPRIPDFGFLQKAWADGQEAVTGLWRRLSPLEEYAAAYMSTAGGLWQGGKVTFDRMLVGSKGVTHESGGFTLNDFGMWKIEAQIWPDVWATSAGNVVSYEIRVIDLDGNIWHRKRDKAESNTDFAAKVSTSVVVPDPGYRVEVHVTNIAPVRSLLGGSERTHLMVHHINRIEPQPGDITGQN